MPETRRAPESNGASQRHDLPSTLAALGLRSTPDALGRLDTFVALLLRWNRTYNLTGARDEKSLVQDHLIDCLAIVPVIEARLDAERLQGITPLIIDVGSGAGFPGLVIAATRPEWHVALVEPLSKKAAFLQQAIAALRLPNARSIARRLEHAQGDLNDCTASLGRSTWHFTSRAVASLSDQIALVQPLARPGSRLFAMKAKQGECLPEGYEVSSHSLSVPGLAKSRSLVEVLLADPAASDPALSRSR